MSIQQTLPHNALWPVSFLDVLKASPIQLALAFIFFDWLDFGLYLYLAKTVFGPLYFSSQYDGFFLSLCLFTISYFARPLGGYFFGKMADTQGRRGPMLYAALCMGLATLSIGLLPPYERIGPLATIGLILCRFFQSLALGGEINISAIYLMEQYPLHRKTIGSFVAIASALGMAMGGIISSAVLFSDNAWRAAIIASGLLSVALCFYRRKLPESNEFIKQDQTLPTLHPKHIMRARLVVLMLAIYTSTMVYQCNIMWSSLAQQTALFNPAICQLLSSLSQMLAAFTALFIATQKTHFRSIDAFSISTLLIAIAGPMLFFSLTPKLILPSLIALILYILGNGFLSACLYDLLYHTFPPQIRCRNVSLYWGLGASLGAASLPFMQYLSSTQAPGVLLFLVSMISFLFLFCERKYPRACPFRFDR